MTTAVKKRTIHAVHLLNDFSGSPLVFSVELKDLVKANEKVKLYTATPSGKGFLSGIDGVTMHSIFYKWSPHKWVTLFYFLIAEVSLFFKILVQARKGDVVYVNTLLPFSALLAAKIKSATTQLHVHEVSLKPALLKRCAVFFAEHFADEIIFVSNYLKSEYSFQKPKCRIKFNSLPAEFYQEAEKNCKKPNREQKSILMLCSLKAYKGVYEFLQLAKSLPQFSFELVLNASKNEVHAWMNQNSIPENCKVFSSQSNTHSFYERAKIVLNLSRPGEWIETFGMTILEAIAYQCYVIVPTVGGPLELLQNYPKGKAIDGKNLIELQSEITKQFA